MTNPETTPHWSPPHQPAQPGPGTGTVGWGVLGKRRNPVAAWLGLPLITLGVYSLVWFYKTTREVAEYARIRVRPGVSVLAVSLGVLLIVPPFVAVWRLCERASAARRAAGLPPLPVPLAFLLFLIGFGPLYLQIQINQIWDRYPMAVEGQQVPLVR